jgi:hypothetical protein
MRGVQGRKYEGNIELDLVELDLGSLGPERVWKRNSPTKEIEDETKRNRL